MLYLYIYQLVVLVVDFKFHVLRSSLFDFSFFLCFFFSLLLDLLEFCRVFGNCDTTDLTPEFYYVI
jgi:hypothetical protein